MENFLRIMEEREPVRVPVGKRGDLVIKLWVECICGEKFLVRKSSLSSGCTKSCGCRSGKSKTNAKKRGVSQERHYLAEHPLYETWRHIKAKTSNENAVNYENVPLEQGWNQYKNFYDWGLPQWSDGLHISRRIAEDGFVPDNCYFCTKDEINTPYKTDRHKSTCMERFGVDSPIKDGLIKQKIKDTYLEKTGYDNPLKNPIVKEKIKSTLIDKYGVDHLSKNPDIIIKRRENNIEKYGVGCPTQLESVQLKIKNTVREKYGVDYIMQCKEFKDKSRATSVERYGHEYPAQSDEIKIKTRLTNLEIYGCHPPHTNCKMENSFRDWLESYGYKFPSTYDVLETHQIDMYCDELKVAVEIGAAWWHSTHKGRDKFYHYNKYKGCKDKGIKLVSIYADEWENRPNQVKNHLKREFGFCSRKIDAQDCDIEPMERKEAIAFYNANSIIATDNVYKAYKIVKENEVLGCFVFRRVINKSTVRLLAPAYLDDVAIENPEWLFSQIPHHPTRTIVAKVNNRFSDDWAATIGFKLERAIDPKYQLVPTSQRNKRTIIREANKKYHKVYNAGYSQWQLSSTGA